MSEPAGREASPPRAGYRSVAVRIVLLTVLLAALGVAIAGLIPSARPHLRHAAVGWIVIGVLLELIACASYALLFHGVFSYGAYRFGYIRGLQIGLGELGAFVVTPTGAGGPALRIWALLRLGMPFRVQMIRTVIHAVILNLPYVLAALLLGIGAALGVGEGHARLVLALAPLGLVFASVLLAAVATLLARRDRAESVARWRRIGRDIIDAVPEGLRELPDRLRELRLLLFAVGYWAGDCGVLIVAFRAAHGTAPIGVIVLAYMLGQLGNSLPVPGGVGAVEPAMLGVLTTSGVNLGLGAAAVVLYRFVSLGLQAVLGTVAVATLVPALQRERRTVQPSSDADHQSDLGPSRASS
jgi:putative heme transporter